tara:strand:+ start:405 stop:614 length:210 start_codon:yes stop_codon:yes gene_type:complete
MQVGDLVTWAVQDDPDFTGTNLGVIVECNEEEDSPTGTLPATFWVRWHGNSDWSMTYEDEIVVISPASS